MSENKDETTDETRDETKDESASSSGVGISDDQLPDDLVPSEDNPLAEGLPAGEAPDEDLLAGGDDADEAGESGESGESDESAESAKSGGDQSDDDAP